MAFDRAAAKAAGYSDAEIDAYLAQKAEAARPSVESFSEPDESLLRSIGRAFEQGALLGFADEAVGGIGAGIELARTGDFGKAARAYRDIRDTERGADAQFAADNPKTNIAARLTGGIASLAATAPGRLLVGSGKTYGALATGGARVGALAGLGESDKDSLSEAAVDAGVGALTGGALAVAVPFAVQQGANAARAGGRFVTKVADTVGPRLGALARGEPVTGSQVLGPAIGQQQAGQYAGALSGTFPEAMGAPGRLIRRADDLGLQMPPGVRYQSDNLRRLEAGLSSNPQYAAPFDAIRQNNASQITDLMAQKMGLPAGTKEISPEIFGAAIDRIKGGLDDVGEQIGRVKIDKAARKELNALMGQATNTVAPNPELASIIGRLQKAHDFNAGTSGKELMNLRSILLKQSQGAWKSGKAQLGEGLDGVIDVLDGMAERSAGPQLSQQWAELRNQWRWAKMFEKGSTFNEATGKVNIGSLRSQLRRDPTYLRGRDITDAVGDDLLDAARFSVLGRDIVGDSGTATRLNMLAMIRNPIESAATGLSRPLVNAYVGAGPRTAPIMGSLLSGPGAEARAAQIGVLAEDNARKGTNKRRRK